MALSRHVVIILKQHKQARALDGSRIGFVLPELAELQTEVPALIEAVGTEGLFADPRITTVVYRKK